MRPVDEFRVDVQQAARGNAEIALRCEDYCTCPSQVQRVARELEVLTAGCMLMVAEENNPATGWLVAGVIKLGAGYVLLRFQDDLHRPGASALPGTKAAHAEAGIDEHC